MKKFFPALLLFFVFTLFFLEGCYGLQNPNECDSIGQLVDKMRCYRRAAINAAYAEDTQQVRIICERINDIGTTYGSLGLNDIKKQAEIEKNRCYFDAAVIIGAKKPNEARGLCEEITESSSVFGLKGSVATQASCLEEVERLKTITPEQYYSNPSNICVLVGILLLPLAALLFNRGVHKL